MNIIKLFIENFIFLWNFASMYKGNFSAYTSSINNHAEYVEYLDRKIGERTTVHADIHHKTPSQVIVVGQYGRKDYVRAFSVSEDNLIDLVRILRDMEKGALVGRFDMPYTLDFSSVYDSERF